MKVEDIIQEEKESYEKDGSICRIIIMKGNKEIANEWNDNLPGDIKPYLNEEIESVHYYSESIYIKILETIRRLNE